MKVPNEATVHPSAREKPMCRLIYLARFWNDDSGVSTVQFAILLAFLSAGFFIAAELISDTIVAGGQEV
jgi:Flp pilus assembly pilin Flp